jgi:FAD synthetase
LVGISKKMSMKIQSDKRFKADPKIRYRIDQAKDVIKKQMKEFGNDGVAIAFNGGKDCTLLLGILATLVDSNVAIQGFYCSKKEFKEVDEFLEAVKIKYKFLKLHKYSDMKDGLRQFLQDNKNVKGILIGTRRSDPNSKGLDVVKETDGDWPRVLRIHPLLDWSYNDIWQGIYQLGLEYCCLYDQAYSSLGDSLTCKNEKLRKNSQSGQENQSLIEDLPAYLLDDEESERMGR